MNRNKQVHLKQTTEYRPNPQKYGVFIIKKNGINRNGGVTRNKQLEKCTKNRSRKMEAANKALKRNCADLLCIFSTDRFVVAQYLGGAPQQCIHIHHVFHRKISSETQTSCIFEGLMSESHTFSL